MIKDKFIVPMGNKDINPLDNNTTQNDWFDEVVKDTEDYFNNSSKEQIMDDLRKSGYEYYKKYGQNFLDGYDNIVKPIINEFVREVEKLAEEKMLKTGKLEGSHYAAMKELQRKINEDNND
jgi:uncharacterized protein YaaR (DUF327 family)